MRLLIIAAIFLWASGCKETESTSFKVTLHFTPFYLGKLYLEKLSLDGSGMEVKDSAELDFKKNQVSFTAPATEEAVFLVRMDGKPLKIYFVNDSREMHIYGITPDLSQYRVANSPSNDALASFRRMLQPIFDSLGATLQHANAQNNPGRQHAYFAHADSLRSKMQTIARNFADTTKSPGAFLFAYNTIDFGKDLPGLDKFIRHAAKRFPGHQAIQELARSTISYIRVFEEEYQVGDTLPPLSLPDENGAMVYTGILPRKFYYIDLWSTWCGQCMAGIPAKKELRRAIPPEKLEIIDIAIENEKENWKTFIRQQQMPGIHLVDEKMWRGVAVNTYKFDSIPYNYLVSPEGRILAKGIPADSVIAVVSRMVK